MRFLPTLILPLAMVAWCVAPLAAQEVKLPQPAPTGVINDLDVTVTDLTEEKINNPPKREIKPERLMEPLMRKLPKPDPKLFEQKFVAAFELGPTPETTSINIFSRNSGEVTLLKFIGENALLSPRRVTSSSASIKKLSRGESVTLMTKFLPAQDLISKGDLEIFADSKTAEGIVGISVTDRYWQFFVLGVTADEAERRAKGLLTLLDQGAFRPIQLDYLKYRGLLCDQLKGSRKNKDTAQQTLNAVHELQKAYSDFTSEMLPGLRVQQLQLDVDLAGVKARIAACEKLLAQANIKPERRNQIEDVKVAAEIELSGFEARRAKSEEFVGKVKTKIELTDKLFQAELASQTAYGDIVRYEREIKSIDLAIRAYAPLPLVDNKITIQPLEWTQ